MSSTTGPEGEPAVERLRAATQQAVDATSSAYTADASIDVTQRLTQELAERGVQMDDPEWLAQVVQAIRSGHGVEFESEPPGGNGG